VSSAVAPYKPSKRKSRKSEQQSKWKEPKNIHELAIVLEYDVKLGGWWGSGEKTEVAIAEKPFAVGSFHAVHCARLFGERCNDSEHQSSTS